VDTLPSWLLSFGLSLGSICHKGKIPGEHLAGLFVSQQVCFLGKETKTCSALPGFYGSHVHTASQLLLRSKQANRVPDFFAGIVFPPFSHSVSLQSYNFLPFVFDSVKKIGQASVAHFKNEMLGYIALQ